MFLPILKEAKEKANKSNSQIATETNLPIKTIERIFAGKTPNPTIATIVPIAKAVNISLEELFVESNAIIGTKNVIELQNTIEELKAANNLLIADNNILKADVESLRNRLEQTEIKLNYSEKLLAVFNFYNKNI